MKKPKPEKIYHIFDRSSLGVAIRSISKIVPSKDKVYRVRVTLDDEDRTIKQNKLAFFWHKIRAEILGHTPDYDRRFCKLNYGVPILLPDPEFFEFWNEALLISSYESQLLAMKFVPVTRIMSTKEFSEYLDAIDRMSATQGIVLPQPSHLYYDALMKQQGSVNA